MMMCYFRGGGGQRRTVRTKKRERERGRERERHDAKFNDAKTFKCFIK